MLLQEDSFISIDNKGWVLVLNKYLNIFTELINILFWLLEYNTKENVNQKAVMICQWNSLSVTKQIFDKRLYKSTDFII